MPAPVTVTGSISRVLFRNDDTGWSISLLDPDAPTQRPNSDAAHSGPIKVTGVFVEPPSGSYQVAGKWKLDTRRTDIDGGWTLAADDIRPILPTSVDGIVAYLCEHATGIGPVRARRCAEVFGATTLEVLRTDPDRAAAEVKGVSKRMAAKVAEQLAARHEVEAVEVAVRGACGGQGGLSGKQIAFVLKAYRGQAAEVVTTNPYRLIGAIPGVGWATADRIGKRVGISPNAPVRVSAGIRHAIELREDRTGHTVIGRDGLVAMASQDVLAVRSDVVSDRVAEMVGSAGAGCLVEDDMVSPVERAFGVRRVVIAARRTWDAEHAVAEGIARLIG